MLQSYISQKAFFDIQSLRTDYISALISADFLPIGIDVESIAYNAERDTSKLLLSIM